MNLTRAWLGLVGVLLALALPMTQALAHQQKAAVTRVLFNPNTSNLEVMHRFIIHDAEHAASLIFGSRQDLLESQESRELFSNYVVNRFAITAVFADGSESALALNYVGAEVDGQYLWVYQETAQPQALSGLVIVNSALLDVWPDQTNLVNIEREGRVYSLAFLGGADELSVDLTEAPD